jgi:hypothetical protein
VKNRVGEVRVLDSLFFGEIRRGGRGQMVFGCETIKCA